MRQVTWDYIARGVRNPFHVVDVWSTPDSGDLEAMVQWCLYSFPPAGRKFDDPDNLPSDRQAYMGRMSWHIEALLVIPGAGRDLFRFAFRRKKDATLFKIFWADHVIPTRE